MAKRRSTLAVATEARRARKTSSGASRAGKQTTAITINGDLWALLRKVSFKRAEATGGRPSVSGIIEELIQKHRRELEQEAGK